MLRRSLVAFSIAASVGLTLIAAKQRAVRIAPPVATPGGPTFSNEVVRIFQEHCQSCHHPGDIAPFSLTNYADAARNADAIKYMVESKKMPPWKPESGCGEFQDARPMPQSAIDVISRWVDSGYPEGERSKLPPALDFTSSWILGEPDLSQSYPQSYTPPASGDMYRCFPLEPTTSEKWVSGIDVRPGDRSTVHHVIAFIDTKGESVRLDEQDPAPGYTCFGDPGFDLTVDSNLGGWAPGYRPFLLPEQVGYQLPANSRIVLQVHYNSHNGQPKPDKTEIGVYFADKKPQKKLYMIPIVNQTFTLAPGDANSKVRASIPFIPYALHAWIVAPHMHLLGKSMKVETTGPNGQTQCLINIPDWDFNWQAMYRFKNPVAIPASSSLTVNAVYDNSAANPRNPNSPPKPVYWGEATTDEMCLAFVGVTIDRDDVSFGKISDTSWMTNVK